MALQSKNEAIMNEKDIMAILKMVGIKHSIIEYEVELEDDKLAYDAFIHVGDILISPGIDAKKLIKLISIL